MSDQGDANKRVIKVPGPADGYREPGDEDLLVAPADLGSASRSCLAILVVLLLIALLLCVFLAAQPFLD